MPYLNVTEVESALATATAAPFDTFTQRLTLPNPTWEGRQCSAVKIANGAAPGRPGVYFLGGVHAREWGSPDILVNFVEQIASAYHASTGLTFGGSTFSAAQIRTIVDNLDIYVFPQANPDGRNHSMTSAQSMWRKNRRTAAPNTATCVGVDINRNYDFVWDFKNRFAPTSTVSCSDDPCDYQVYHGSAAFSEPETQNAKWLFDAFPNIGYFVDLHSFGEDILYSWGDDDNQSSDASQNFQNGAFDAVRGILDAGNPPNHAAYREYIPADELSARIALANAFSAGIQAVRGKNYLVEQSVGLYPTSGASDDYAYCRHYVDASQSNVMAYTLEWGTEFQPPYAEMQNIIADVTSGLIAFCLWVRTSIERIALVTDRNTFGKDEIDALLHLGAPARVDAAFYVQVDGFRHEELGVSAATLSGTPNVAPTIGFAPGLGKVHAVATACSCDGNVLVDGPQRFTWTYALVFDDSSDFTQEVRPVTLTATLPTTLGTPLTAQGAIVLLKQPNPYEIDGAVSWLSVDLQVCQVLANQSLPSTPQVVLNAGPNAFIQQLLAKYNDPALPRAPNHPFDLDLVANQDASSVEIASQVGGTNVYNFAIARVRYRALATPAPNVRVFFRLFQASTTSTEYQPASTYATGGSGGNTIPLLGVIGGDVVTIPCFAAARVDPTNAQGLNAQTDPANVGPLGAAIPPDASGAEVQVYFGCWLDINQTTPVLPAAPASAAGPFTPVQSIQQAIKNKHQCLVAEINLDPPHPAIATGSSPATSDKLAQRNLTIVGVASPHRVPCTFELKPTAVDLPTQAMPDELMLDFARLPAGTTANVYLPDIDADALLAQATQRYRYHAWRRVDAHTVACDAAGVAYLPVPARRGAHYAGLLTLDLPSSLGRERAYGAVAKQLTAAHGLGGAAPGAKQGELLQWRKVLGAFQVQIPVRTRAGLLQSETRLLSVLRWIARSIAPDSRWHAVFARYLEQTAGRVQALGGDPAQVAPSPRGDGQRRPCSPGRLLLAAIVGALLAALAIGLGLAPALALIAYAALLVLLLVVFVACQARSGEP